ncbi:MAG: protein-glutamate O-methyltransferase CheR [Pseudomonadota bacterium]
MQDTTFNEIADLALRLTGQVIQPSKSYLVKSRLAAICRRESFSSLDDLAHCIKSRPNPRFEKEVAAALTSKQTSFFGDRDLLERIVTHALPHRLKASKTGRLRVWCAGVATGQEAYSLALRLSEEAVPALKGAEIEIVGTDISPDCIQVAEAGTYGHFDVQKGLSIHRLMLNFSRQDTGDWRISQKLRDTVSFRLHNLLEDASSLGQFDVILCRNVLSQIAPSLHARVAQNLANQLLPGALLMAGRGESLTGLLEDLEPSRDVRGAYIRKSKSGAVAA